MSTPGCPDKDAMAWLWAMSLLTWLEDRDARAALVERMIMSDHCPGPAEHSVNHG